MLGKLPVDVAVDDPFGLIRMDQQGSLVRLGILRLYVTGDQEGRKAYG